LLLMVTIIYLVYLQYHHHNILDELDLHSQHKNIHFLKMSFYKPEQMYYEKPILGSGCSCAESVNPIHPKYYGDGIGDILDKLLSPSTTSAISKVVSALPSVYDTIKNVVNTDPQELNKKLESVLQQNPSTITDVLKSINTKGSGLKKRKKRILNNHSEMILQKILEKHGSGLQTY